MSGVYQMEVLNITLYKPKCHLRPKATNKQTNLYSLGLLLSKACGTSEGVVA